jgi:23S rRNA (uracil1939-C5)-methyltransferase
LIKIHDLARGGSGVGKLESGAVVFVPFTAPGDEIEIKILETSKRYSEAACTEIIVASPARVPPTCAVFGKCGGCSWQHIHYALQFATKKKGVLQALKRAGIDASAIPLDEIPAKNLYGYRNRVQLHGEPRRKIIGFYAHKAKEIVSIDHCPISRPEINDQLLTLAKIGFEQFQAPFKLEIEVGADGKTKHAFNEAHGAFGFRQVNDEQNEKLKAWVKANIVSAPLLLDLYGGQGNLSLPLLDQFQEIRCIDVSAPEKKSPSAHFHFVKSDIRKWARAGTSDRTLRKPASVILDPPRSGLGADFSEIEAELSRHRLHSVVLVSCDVDSFVRDTQHFLQKGYRLARLGVLDIFPQTPHLESLALFFK